MHLLKLQLQLGDDLHLNPGLGRALVVEHVLVGQVLLKLGRVVASGVAASPLADPCKKKEAETSLYGQKGKKMTSFDQQTKR